jgi:acetyl esterase
LTARSGRTLEPAVRAHVDATDTAAIRAAAGDISARRDVLRRSIDRNFTLFGLPGPEVYAIRDHSVPIDGGEILVRSYHPSAEPGLPAHIALHGGGWATGSIEELVADGTARHRAVAANCVVVAVEYRLAPEFPFPAAVHDTVAATRWVREQAAALGADPGIITLGGISAGANLAAAAVLADPDLRPAALLLEVPALDLRPDAVFTEVDLGTGYEGFTATALTGFRQYLGGDPERGRSPLASPVLAEDLTGFPETHILTAELDALRASAELFARRLREAGVPTSITCYQGALHGSSILTATWPTARRWHDDTLAILADVHHRHSGERRAS